MADYLFDIFCLLVNTLSLGKPEKGKMVEELIVNMAKRGQLPGKLGEQELIGLLESVSQQTKRTTTVKVSVKSIIIVKCTLPHKSLIFLKNFQYDRRRAALDSDDDL